MSFHDFAAGSCSVAVSPSAVGEFRSAWFPIGAIVVVGSVVLFDVFSIRFAGGTAKMRAGIPTLNPSTFNPQPLNQRW